MTKRIGIIVGSIRTGSYTRSFAEAVANMFGEGYETEFIEIENLPFYNEGHDNDEDRPDVYNEFRDTLARMDGFVFATPEYNRSIPGVLKNAIDVGSRPYGESKWNKPSYIVSVSPGDLGGFGANHHLRQVLVILDTPLVQQPETYVRNATAFLDEDGKVTNPEMLALLQSGVDALENLISRYDQK